MPNRASRPDLRQMVLDHEIRDGVSWIVATGVPHWEGFVISLRATMSGAQPRISAVHVDPTDRSGTQDVTGLRLRSLPISAIAHAALRWDSNVFRNALSTIADEQRHDSRAEASVHEVARVYLDALDANRTNPRFQVAKTLLIGERTADRYIRKARDLGLIPETKRSRRTSKQPERMEQSD